MVLQKGGDEKIGFTWLLIIVSLNTKTFVFHFN